MEEANKETKTEMRKKNMGEMEKRGERREEIFENSRNRGRKG